MMKIYLKKKRKLGKWNETTIWANWNDYKDYFICWKRKLSVVTNFYRLKLSFQYLKGL